MNAEQIKHMRKTAFEVGVARYMHEHGVGTTLQAAADNGAFTTLEKLASPLLLAALPSAIAFGGGNAGGGVLGHAYGMATGASPETIAEREFELAEATTQQLIDELRAKRHNKQIKSILSGGDTGQARHPALSWAR